MADIEIESREDRRAALDAFAQAGANASPPAVVPAAGVIGSDGMGLRVVGAQKVAVPRELPKGCNSLALLAARAGDNWYYRWSQKDKRTGKTIWVEGPSIKCANDVARTYGNCEIETRVLDTGDTWIIYARFTDYETGFSMTRPFQQRKGQRVFGDRAMSEDAARAQDAVFQIGVSKAIRNVVTNSLQTFADYAFEEARNALVDKIGKDLDAMRAKTIAKLATKVDVKRAEMVLGRPAADWLAPDVAQVMMMMKVVADGMSTIDEQFPPLAPPPGEAQPAADKLNEFSKAADSGTPPVAPDEAAAGGANPRQPAAAKSDEEKKLI
jgi:hypothetical protein